MEILTNFGIQPVLLLAQIVNFLIILFILKKFFYKPITKALEDRKQKIAESLKNAEEIEKKLAETEEKSAKILEETKISAQQIITEAKKESQRLADQASVDARKTMEEAVNQAQSQIANQKEEMKKSLEKETLRLVADVVEKILGRAVRNQERQALTKSALTEITRKIQ